MRKGILSITTLLACQFSFAQCNELFFSEYVEGSGNNKALEIYNPTNAAIDLSNYKIKRYSNGASVATGGYVTVLSGSIAPFKTFVIANGQTTGTSTSPVCDPALQALANMLDGAYPAPTYMNGNDAVTLEKAVSGGADVIVDIFGKIGEDPGTAWTNTYPFTGSSGKWITKDLTLRRKQTVKSGVSVNPTDFDALAEWDTTGYDGNLSEDNWTGLGNHTCDCETASVGVSENNLSVVVAFSPNPVRKGSSISISSSERIRAIKMISLSGQEVFSENYSDLNAVNVTPSVLNSGIYMVSVVHADGVVKRVKIAVQ